MKYITTLFVFLLSLVILVYITLFTPIGNNIVKPFLEKEITKEIHLEVKLNKFRFNISSAEIQLVLNKSNIITIKANYSLLEKSFNCVYRINFKELSRLQALTQKPLQGSFKTEGSVIGNLDQFIVEGVSDIASSDSSYHIEVSKLTMSSIKAKFFSLELQKLLYILKEKEYADAKMDIDINFKNITLHKLDGIVKLSTSHGYLNKALIKHDFDITIPKGTRMAMQLDAKFKGDNVEYAYSLYSKLANLSSSGKVVAEPLSFNLIYKVDVKELGLFKPLSGIDLQGPLQVDGKVRGTTQKLQISAKTNFAASDTVIQMIFGNFKPKSIQAKIRSLKMQKALYTLKLPHYSDGVVDMDIAIKNANVGRLNGLVTTKISYGKLDSKYLTREMKFSSLMPKTTYSLEATTKLKNSEMISSVNLYSNLLELHTKKTVFNLTNDSLKSDYNLKLGDLSKFYFITKHYLKGALVAKGNISYTKELDVSMYSDIADGKLTLTLHNDLLKANLNSLKTLTILDMTLYPKFFDARVNADILYNVATKKGDIDAKLLSGSFTKNKPLDLVKQYGHIDMYAEKFDGDLKAKIEKEKLIGSLFLKSNNSSIRTKNARLNTKTNTINSKIDINANGNPVKVTLRGDINRPKVSISADELLKREATKVIHKEVSKFLKKFF